MYVCVCVLCVYICMCIFDFLSDFLSDKKNFYFHFSGDSISETF